MHAYRCAQQWYAIQNSYTTTSRLTFPDLQQGGFKVRGSGWASCKDCKKWKHFMWFVELVQLVHVAETLQWKQVTSASVLVWNISSFHVNVVPSRHHHHRSDDVFWTDSNPVMCQTTSAHNNTHFSHLHGESKILSRWGLLKICLQWLRIFNKKFSMPIACLNLC